MLACAAITISRVQEVRAVHRYDGATGVDSRSFFFFFFFEDDSRSSYFCKLPYTDATDSSVVVPAPAQCGGTGSPLKIPTQSQNLVVIEFVLTHNRFVYPAQVSSISASQHVSHTLPFSFASHS